MTIEDIALTMTPGLGVKWTVRLLEVFGSAENIFRSTREELMHFASLSLKAAEAITAKVAFAQAEREVEYCRRHSITPIASTDALYPPLLLQIPDYPHVIYVVGDPLALLKRNVSIIGTRRMSAYGDRMCHEIVSDLSQKSSDISIISGLAFGVDAAAHRAALHCGVTTVAVVANALPAVTPTQHTSLAADIVAHGGAIVSEYHSQTKQRGTFYIARNRIIAALSGVTVVVESPISGGSMATAGIAHGYDRLVLAIPARLTDTSSAGCNMLIRNKQADLLFSADQIIREMMWDCDAAADRPIVADLNRNLAPQHQAIVDCFAEQDTLSLEELEAASALSISELLVLLTEMELDGIVRMINSNRYELLHVRTTV